MAQIPTFSLDIMRDLTSKLRYEHRKAKMVAEITGTDYFREFQQRARELRKNRSGSGDAS